MSLPATFRSDFHDEDAVKRMPYRPLGDTGMDVSALSLGASSLGSVFRPTNEEESLKLVRTALSQGINYLDTAPWYGHTKSETVLGKVLPSIPRSSYYLSTKVGRYEEKVDKMFDFSAERTLRSVDESLHRLGLDYVDIIQVHDMEFAPNLEIIINETLPALQKVKEAGKAKFIGITGYPLQNFKTVIDRSHVKIDTVLTYCRGTINDNSLREWLPYFKEKKVGVINASPISMGLLSKRGPPEWHPAHDNIKAVCAQAVQYCNERDVDISRLGLKFSVDQEDIPTVLVSTASHENCLKNIRSVSTPLTETEREVMEAIIEKFMMPLNNANWEGREVDEYWRDLNALKKE